MPTSTFTDEAGCQFLNAADRLMFVAHKGMRGIDHSGFLCQTHVWLAGRLDAAALRSALCRLHEVYPVVTSRLEDTGGKAVPCWRYRPEAPPELQQIELTASDDAAVFEYAERLFEQPMDHDRDDPISFHLLHLPDGRDVLLLRFSHVLMDGKTPEYVLKEIDRFFARPDSSLPTASMHETVRMQSAGFEGARPDEMQAHLLRFERKRRVQAALRVVRSHIRWPARPATMTPSDKRDWLVRPYGIALRTLTQEQTDAVLASVKRLCGFANATPMVLAAAFRAIRRVCPHPTNGRTIFQTDVPLNLRPPGRAQPIFRNFMSFIQLTARGDELADRDEATTLLNMQMRDQIRQAIDLGNLQMMAVMAPHARMLHRHILTRMKNQPFTLGFGFLGPVTAGLERFCGQDVDRLYSLNSAISPPGITLQANQFRRRLNLMMTYIKSAVPDTTATALLDGVVEDLIRA